MSGKRILAIGCGLDSESVEHEEFTSKASLLDWDIVLFKPDVDALISYAGDSYKGKPSLGDTRSFALRESCEHWRRELKQAVEAGKTVIVFLSPLSSVYIDTGEREYSGTGRNQKTTRIVSEYDNYKTLPTILAPVVASGTEMKLASNVAPPVAAFWSEFRTMFSYKVLLTDEKVPGTILTKTGNKVVGSVIQLKPSGGTLLLLPDLDFYKADFLVEKNGDTEWTEEATKFANRFVDAIVRLDGSLRAESDVTPEPSWAISDAYLLAPERDLRSKLMTAELKLEKAQREKEELTDKLKGEGLIRGLLFEKGKPLERAILEALRKLGFGAESFKENGSEFDVVFESAEGRLIGEAEGKDNKAINVDKLRQLQMNIHEDLLRDEVSTPAKPVLFGNAYRLLAPSERGEPFTEKCVAAAATMNTALVATPDLFTAAQYFVESQDLAFAAACRSAILSSTGRVSFPAIPDGVFVVDSTGERDEP